MSESAIHNSTASGAATNRTGSQSAIHLSPNQKALRRFRRNHGAMNEK